MHECTFFGRESNLFDLNISNLNNCTRDKADVYNYVCPSKDFSTSIEAVSLRMVEKT